MGGGAQAAAPDNRPGGGLGAPIDAPDPLHDYRAYILGAFALVLVMGGAYIVSRSNHQQPATATAGNGGKVAIDSPAQAGDFADSYSYMAEFYLMTGNLQMAITQLQLALSLPGLDAVQRARYSARLEEVRSYLPKKSRDAVADDRGSNNGHY